ncbi:phage terminase large subunit [Halosimplex halophilum]|uniref:phage terminase large subunit n=1 Tax=Halosimplex halophilum TaxID=2559572 RepID=UPI00107F3113|nr:phage terminase large subunit [Halosimplex halophilum]
MATSDAGDQGTPLQPAPQYSVHETQREVLQSDARYRVCRWGRRAGKNVTGAIDVVEYCRRPWASQWGPDDPQKVLVWWVGPTYDQALKHGFEKVKSAVPNAWIASSGRSEPYYIEFVNGARVEFRTFDKPESLQGEGVDRIVLDEADQMREGIWYGDLEPMLLDSRGCALFISKPYRPRSWFHRFYDYGQSADYPEYASWHATSADNPFLAEDPEDKRGTVPPHLFEREYLAELPDDGGQVFRDLDDKLFTGDYEVTVEREHDPSGEFIGELRRSVDAVTTPVAIGADFARSRDYRVTAALDAAGDLAYYHRARNESWDGIEDHLRGVYDTYGGILLPDASRDNKIVADLAGAGVRVSPVSFSPKTKKQLIETLATLVETGELSVPDVEALDQLHLELRQLQEDVSESGYTRYHAPDDGYDDSVDALALAASKFDRISRSASRRASRDDTDTGVSTI